MNGNLIKILIFVGLLMLSCKPTLVKKWASFNSRTPSIALDEKGENGVGGNYLIERSSNPNSNNRRDAYYLRNAAGQTIDLGIELNWIGHQLLYFEFTESSLFVITHYGTPHNKINVHNFSLETGEQLFLDGGVIPCERTVSIKRLWEYRRTWKLGNAKCNWIDFQSHKVSFIRPSLVTGGEGYNLELYEFVMFSYDWLENELDTLPHNFSVGIDAVTGVYLGLRNIDYHEEKGQFEY
ncbi:MAG: hypothetical protein AAF433_02825 [Bacteroidota bacterium]